MRSWEKCLRAADTLAHDAFNLLDTGDRYIDQSLLEGPDEGLGRQRGGDGSMGQRSSKQHLGIAPEHRTLAKHLCTYGQILRMLVAGVRNDD